MTGEPKSEHLFRDALFTLENELTRLENLMNSLLDSTEGVLVFGELEKLIIAYIPVNTYMVLEGLNDNYANTIDGCVADGWSRLMEIDDRYLKLKQLVKTLGRQGRVEYSGFEGNDGGVEFRGYMDSTDVMVGRRALRNAGNIMQ